MKSSRNGIIAVVGPYKAGTGTVAGIVNRLGASLGTGEIANATPALPTGDHQNHDIFVLHRMLLGSLWCEWKSPDLPHGWRDSDVFRDGVGILIGIMENQFRGGLVVVKDPAMCSFFNVWKAAADACGLPLSAILADTDTDDILSALVSKERLTGSDAENLTETLRRGMAEWEQVPHASVRVPDDLLSVEKWKAIESEIGVTWPVAFEAAWPRVVAFVGPPDDDVRQESAA